MPVKNENKQSQPYNVEVAVKNKAEQMKEQLASQPKVMVMIPLERGEKIGQAKHTFTINGYNVTYPKGEQVAVPEQIAQMVNARFYQYDGIVRAKSLDGRTPEALS